MTIEEKALKEWGVATDCLCGLWILKDGTILNGCQSGYVRDVDHGEIGQFFKRSVYQDPGSNWIYVKKFIKRGNIRMSMEGSAYFELGRVPTQEQWRAMGRCFARARQRQLEIQIERMGSRPGLGKLYTRLGYIEYLSRYVPSLVT